MIQWVQELRHDAALSRLSTDDTWLSYWPITFCSTFRQLLYIPRPMCTSVDELEDASEAGVVSLNVVCMKLENEVRRRRVEASLS